MPGSDGGAWEHVGVPFVEMCVLWRRRGGLLLIGWRGGREGGIEVESICMFLGGMSAGVE